MERITNNVTELRNTAKLEIENFELAQEDKIIAHFSQFPSIGSFHFKMVVIEDNDGKIRSGFRQWDTEYDFTRWHNGIYNLDRLRIITEEKNLSEAELENLHQLLSDLIQKSLPDRIDDTSAIVLDGSDWQFGISFKDVKVDYHWKSPTEDIALFAPVIEFMIELNKAVNRRIF